jgi:hypothetical protein
MITQIDKDGIKFVLRGYRVPAAQIGDEPDPINPNAFETDIKAEVVTNDYGGRTFKILNGVTGYEQWELARILAADDIKGDFLVCAGTKNRWDQLAIYEHEWATFSDYAKELLKNSPDMAQINVQAQNLGTAMERLGVSAQDASKSLRHAINCIPEEIWELLEAEIKRRGI